MRHYPDAIDFQVFPSPILFVPRLDGQKESYESLLVVLENISTGEIMSQKVLILSDVNTWDRRKLVQWMQVCMV